MKHELNNLHFDKADLPIPEECYRALMDAACSVKEEDPVRADNKLFKKRRLEEETAPNPPRRYAHRLSFGVVALLILLVASIGIAAGVHFGVFDFMARMFGQSDVLPQASKLVQNNLATLETEHATVTLTQAVYDGGNLRMVYSVRQKDASSPITEDELYDENSSFRKAISADSVSPWGCDWFYLDGTEYSMTSGSGVETIPGMENGEALCYLDICLASADIVPQDSFDVRLPVIVGRNGDETTLAFTVNVSEAMPSQYPILKTPEATLTVLNTSLSPVRAYANLRIEKNEDASAQAFDFLLSNWRGAMLVDAEGTELSTLSEFQEAVADEGKCIEYNFTFLPTDASEVYLAPMTIDDNNNWLLNMSQALKLK